MVYTNSYLEKLMISRESLQPKGRVEIFTSKGRPKINLIDKITDPALNPFRLPLCRSHSIDFRDCQVIDKQDIKNIVVNFGKDAVITSLSNGVILTLARLAIGDRGSLPTDPTVPKIPTATMTELYNETYRADAEAVVLNVGTPDIHELKLIKTFAAVDVPITAFSNQAKPVVNEVGAIMINPALPPPLPRPPVAAPDSPPADEQLFAIRTYKSVPFEAANDISVTIRYTIYIE
jgi:hypothetical protein